MVEMPHWSIQLHTILFLVTICVLHRYGISPLSQFSGDPKVRTGGTVSSLISKETFKTAIS